jgi:hypothetical protein
MDDKPLLPKDRSLEAYKEWIINVAQKIQPDAKDSLSESEWKKRHKAFWEDVDSEVK